MFKFFQCKKHCVSTKHFFSFLLLSAICFTSGIQSARADNAANWQKIHEVDSKLQSASLDWHYTRTVGPHPVPPEETYQRLEEQLRKNGLNAEAVKNDVASSRAFDKELAQGIEYDGILRCLRMKNEMRLDKTFSSKSGGTRSPKKMIIDYTDGKTGLFIDGTDVNSKSLIPQWGRVVSNVDPSKTLIDAQDSSYRLLLFGMPLTSVFPPAKTKMTDNGNGTITLETVESTDSDFPVTIRGVISKTSWRPVKIERLPPLTTSPTAIFEASDFHVYENGVLLPTHFTYKDPANSDTISCTLQKAIIGQEIPDKDIKIMYGPNIQDCRFDGCIQYKLISGIIPNKEKVEEMKSAIPAQKVPQKGNVPMLAPPLFALFLTAMGGLVFWVETRKHREGK